MDKSERLEILLQLLSETPEVIARFKRWWHEYYTYRLRYSSDKDVRTIEADKDIVFSQFDILEGRISKMIMIAEKIAEEVNSDGS